jgi:hypothetical protein
MENRFENNPPEERQDWGAYLKPPSYSGPPNSNALDAHVQNLCARVQEMLPYLLENDGDIRPEVASSIYAHLAVCLSCAKDFAEMQRIVAMVEAVAPPEMPLDFSAIIMQRIEIEFSPARSDVPIRPLRAASSDGSGEAAASKVTEPTAAAPQAVTETPVVRIVSNTTMQTAVTGQNLTQTGLDLKQQSMTVSLGALWQRLTGIGLMIAVVSFFLLSDWGRQIVGVNTETASSLLGQAGDAMQGVPLIGAIVGLVATALANVAGTLQETYRTMGATTTLGLALDLGILTVGYYFLVARKPRHQIKTY